MTHIDTSTEAVEALLKDVTPGPWYTLDCGRRFSDKFVWYDGDGARHGETPNIVIFAETIPNASFLAASRELVPALLAERDKYKRRAEQAEKREQCLKDSTAEARQLQRELNAMKRERDQLRDELDAKLAKAVEALDRIQHGSYGKNAAMARTALKQLTGGKDE